MATAKKPDPTKFFDPQTGHTIEIIDNADCLGFMATTHDPRGYVNVELSIYLENADLDRLEAQIRDIRTRRGI